MMVHISLLAYALLLPLFLFLAISDRKVFFFFVFPFMKLGNKITGGAEVHTHNHVLLYLFYLLGKVTKFLVNG